MSILRLNKCLDDLHNFLSIIKLQVQVIGTCEHKVKKSSCRNGSLAFYTFEFEPTTSAHGGVGFFINDNYVTK